MKGTLFGDALFQIEIPTPNSLSENWIHFEEKLRAQLQTYKDVGYKWDLSSINDTRFHDFVYLNKLMVDCLQVAFVRDREAILSKILTVD